MESQTELDEIDNQILKYLQKNAKTPLKKIADEVGKTETTIRRRIRALEECGVISNYTIRVCLSSEERKIKSFLRIDSEISKTRDIIKKLLEFPEIEHIYHMSGECGIWVLASFNNISNLDQFLKRCIGKTDGIRSVINCIILNELNKMAKE
ncbi:MAG: Lrp/AsnC family transcriptional regulator [Candidatus Helarchaeota archaeon]|nr:Lrp/AsnC family transcriptional regulator [Candidatus Helarchaeota archaeon]